MLKTPTEDAGFVLSRDLGAGAGDKAAAMSSGQEVLPPQLWVESGRQVVVHGYSQDVGAQKLNDFLAVRMEKSRLD